MESLHIEEKKSNQNHFSFLGGVNAEIGIVAKTPFLLNLYISPLPIPACDVAPHRGLG